jgi:hypothetical protein
VRLRHGQGIVGLCGLIECMSREQPGTPGVDPVVCDDCLVGQQAGPFGRIVQMFYGGGEPRFGDLPLASSSVDDGDLVLEPTQVTAFCPSRSGLEIRQRSAVVARQGLEAADRGTCLAAVGVPES